uniref:Calcium dependent mitochondrial carrier protein n=1 Tax=Ganoderma boninense TaxID=34458 RepID=A0A5K1JTP7_9APHY|nr:Calcium dependent mitochondrial carrier protein [Ganoderma boninense]
MTSALPPLAQACSGALGSAAANAISYPLDLVATKLQTTSSRKFRAARGALLLILRILDREGLAGLYDGLPADTASTLLSNFLYFYFYTLLHALAARRRAASSAPLLQTVKGAITSPTRPVLLGAPTELAVGFVAGVASRAISTPLSVITVRLQTSDDDEDNTESQTEVLTVPKTTAAKTRRPGFRAVLQSIYAEESLCGFWAGFRPALPLCLTPALTFLLMQVLSRLRLPRKSLSASHQSALGAFLAGATANAITVTILYPLLLAKVRVQAGRGRTGRTLAMTDVWIAALKAEGWRGLYAALGVQIMKGFVGQGVTMLVKQRWTLDTFSGSSAPW